MTARSRRENQPLESGRKRGEERVYQQVYGRFRISIGGGSRPVLIVILDQSLRSAPSFVVALQQLLDILDSLALHTVQLRASALHIIAGFPCVAVFVMKKYPKLEAGIGVRNSDSLPTSKIKRFLKSHSCRLGPLCFRVEDAPNLIVRIGAF